MTKIFEVRAKVGPVLPLLIVVGMGVTDPIGVFEPGAAWAESHSGGGIGPGAGSGKGERSDGGHDEDHDDSHDEGHDDGHDDGREPKSGKGEHADDGHDGGGEGHDPIGGERAGQADGDKGTRGGGPVWSKEGIPEVELGRLNVVRSPDTVLDRAFEEAKASFSPSVAAFYAQDLDTMISSLSLDWDNVTFIDSPLQNLALLRDSLDGQSVLSTVGIDTDVRTLQAVFLGTASDKTVPISRDTVLAVTTILGQPMDHATAETVARAAEKIRIAILAGHG